MRRYFTFLLQGSRRINTISGFLFLILSSSLFSQTDHYWAQQYGATATLTGGAMIGGVRDNSAIFYNPGAVSFIQFPSLSVTANLYKMDKIFIDDGAGDGINLNSAQISIFPQIISGMVQLKKLPRFKFVYSLLTRNFDNVLMNTRYTDDDFTAQSPDVQAYVGSFNFANQLNEQWFGLGVGFRVNDRLGIGVSVFGSYRTQTNQMRDHLREISQIDSSFWVATITLEDAIKFRTVSGLIKAGLAYETGQWKIGLTVTTPSFRVYGRGDIEREMSIYALSENPQDTSISYIITDRQNDARAYYHHPWALGAGVEYASPKTRIALSAEYYFKIKNYVLMAPASDPFVYPPEIADSAFIRDITENFLRIQTESRPVCNIGIGLEQQLWERITLLAGFHTDFYNYKKSDNSDVLLVSSGVWDLYHISAGLSYTRSKQVITAGFSYAFSPNVPIDPFAIINPYQNFSGKANVFAQTFAFIIGYTYLFPRE